MIRKKKFRKDVAKSLFTGSIFGVFALIGTAVGNYLWWYQLHFPETIHTFGLVSTIGFFACFFLIAIFAIRELNKE